MIARDEDLSDSEDEGDGRRNESVGHHDNKRARLADEGGETKPAPVISKTTGGSGGSIQSPVPPEPSPITPSPVVHQTQESKAETAQEKTGT